MSDLYFDKLNKKEKLMAKKYPGKTVVLNAKTLRLIIASDNPLEIANKIMNLKSVVPLFMGPFNKPDICIHQFCK